MTLVKKLPRFQQAYRELVRLEQRETWSRSEIETYQLERVNALWRNACENTPHYRELKSQRSLPTSFRSLNEYYASVPIVTKDEMRQKPDAFCSEIKQRGEWVFTGGATGEPFKNYFACGGFFVGVRFRVWDYSGWGG